MSDLEGGVNEWWAFPVAERLRQRPKVGFDVTCQSISDAMGTLEPLLVAAADEIDRLKAALKEAQGKINALNDDDPICAKCGHPKSNPPFRHPFQG